MDFNTQINKDLTVLASTKTRAIDLNDRNMKNERSWGSKGFVIPSNGS